jgi:arsenite-transporting ATPase
VSRTAPARRIPRFEFVGGKGGVGKTTTAAALALAAAGAGRRTLLLSTDPAHSLGDALGRRVGARVTRVPGPGAALDALELDADRALARWLRARVEALRLIAERGTYLDDADLDRFLGLGFPGVDELAGLLEMARLAEAGSYEAVVIDTAPTGHTLRLLGVPETLGRIAAVLDEMLAKHHFLLTRLSGGDRRDAADRLVDEIAAEAARLAALVRDRQRARFRWIVLPEMLAVEEGRDAVQALEATGVAVDEIVVNRVTGRDARRPGPDHARLDAEARAIAAVRSAFGDRRIRLVPEQPVEPRGLTALRSFARTLGRGGRTPSGSALRAAAAPRRRTRPGRGAAPPAFWTPLLAPPGLRLLLFAGKGGVGKSTCAAAAALALADEAPSRRVLLLSTDPAHSLGDVLAAAVGDEARTVPGAPAALAVRELDARRMFARRRERYRAAVDALFDAIRGKSRLDVAFDRAVARDLLDLAPGGLDELCALLAVTEALFPAAAPAASHDLVVVDTAPTGHTLRLLALPELALEWVRALLTTLLKYRQVLGLGALAEDLVDLSRGLRQLQALLTDARQARVVVVTRAAALPRLETRRLLRRLDALGLAVSALVVNALAPPDRGGAGRARAEAAELTRLRAMAGRRTGRVPLLLAPAVAPPPRGVRALDVWARTWARAAS